MSDSATETPAETVVTLTEEAQARARFFLKEEGDEDSVLRLGVTTGGCSGFEYMVKVDTAQDDDIVQSYEGFRVVIDPVSKQFIDGSILNYLDTVGFAGFKFENPQAKDSCGCGKSFDYEL